MGSSITLSLAVGAAAAGVYAFSNPPEARKKLTALGYASGAALVSASLAALFGYDTLQKISKTRYCFENAGTAPQHLLEQMAAIITPRITERVQGADDAISAENDRHGKVVARHTDSAASIKRDLADSKTLPDRIAQLHFQLLTAQKTHAVAARELSALERADLAITTADRAEATTEFEEELEAAQNRYKGYILGARHRQQPSFIGQSSRADQPTRTFSHHTFFSEKIRKHLPDTLQNQNASYQTLHEHFLQNKATIISHYALPIAEERRNQELSIAGTNESRARATCSTFEVHLKAASTRLTTIKEKQYDDENVCNAAVKDEEAKIKSENNDHESYIETLNKEKDIAELETDDDREFAKTVLLESCSSENNSWYTGWTASSTVTALTAAAGLWYYIAHK